MVLKYINVRQLPVRVYVEAAQQWRRYALRNFGAYCGILAGLIVNVFVFI